MTSKTIAFKHPTALARPAEDWVEARTRPTSTIGSTKRLTVDVSADLHKRLKIHCANTERQISDVVRDLLEREYPAA
jgi:ParG